MSAWRLALLGCALAVAAGGCAHPGGVTLAHVLRIAVPSDPGSLSPLVAFAQTDIADDLLFAQTLIGLDRTGKLTPVLVTRVPSHANGDVSPDGRRITYHLRPGVRFADGVPLTSADVRFTYLAMLDPRNRAAGVTPYRRIAKVETPDAHTVVIDLRERWNAAVSELFAESDFAIGILPAHAFGSTQVVGAGWDDHAFGTGPFRVVAWRRGDRLIMEPNPYFVPKPKLERLEVRFIPNTTSSFVALRSGDVDVALIGTNEALELRSRPDLSLRKDPLNGDLALTLQMQASPTDALLVRRAIADALDYRALADVDHDLFPQFSAIFGPSVVTWRRGPLEPSFVHDAARAAREFDAAGWKLAGGVRSRNGTRMELTLVVDAASGAQARFGVVVQRDLGLLGVPVTIKAFPDAVLDAVDGPERNGRFSIAFTGAIGGSDPEPTVEALRCSEARPGGANYGRFCSAPFETAFDDQVVTPSGARRNADFAEMERIVREQIPLVPFQQYTTLWGVSTRVEASYARDPLDFPLHAETWDTRAP